MFSAVVQSGIAVLSPERKDAQRARARCDIRSGRIIPVSVYRGLLQLIWQRAELLNVCRQRLDYYHPGVR